MLRSSAQSSQTRLLSLCSSCASKSSSVASSTRIRPRSAANRSHTLSSSSSFLPNRMFSSAAKDTNPSTAAPGKPRQAQKPTNQQQQQRNQNRNNSNNKNQRRKDNNKNNGSYWTFAGSNNNKNSRASTATPSTYPLGGKKDSSELFQEYKNNIQNVSKQNSNNKSNKHIQQQNSNNSKINSTTRTGPSPLDSLREKFAAMKQKENNPGATSPTASDPNQETSSGFQQILGKNVSSSSQAPSLISSFGGGKQKQSSSETPILAYLDEYVQNMAERRQQRRQEEQDKISSNTSPLSILNESSSSKSYEQKKRNFEQQKQDANNQAQMAQAYLEKARREKAKQDRKSRKNVTKPKDESVVLPNYTINLQETSLLFRVAAKKLRSMLQKMGEWPENADQKEDNYINIEPETLQLLAMELNRDFKVAEVDGRTDDRKILLERRALAEAQEQETADESKKDATPAYESLPPRPPVVCIMGHVDHGKTTLMDTLRRMSRKESGGEEGKKKKKKKSKKRAKTANKDEDSQNVAGTEAGGITQVISAFEVPLPGTGSVTFLDTPGHAAFKSMRQSGTDAADIIVLVVAADDGVSPQTVEILNFYKSIVQGSGGSGISLVIAMNKIDKPGVNVHEARMAIEGQLLEHGILVEGMPGSAEGVVGSPAQLFPISGLTGEGVEDLVEGLVLQSEVMDLRADDTARAEGYVMDARVERGLGTVVDSVVRWGSIQKGDFILSGKVPGKVRLLMDVNGKPLKKGTPSQPVRIVGFDGVPKAGDPIICLGSEDEVDELVQRRIALEEKLKAAKETGDPLAVAELQSAGKHFLQSSWKSKLEERHGLDDKEQDTRIRIPVIIRADADGTLSAIHDSLVGMGEESEHNILIDPIVKGVGPVLKTEIQLAKESKATIVCFNVKTDAITRKLADDEDVPLLSNDVIYRLLEESRQVFGRHLPLLQVEKVVGRAKVGAVYDIGGIATRVAGLTVTEGSLYKTEYVLEEEQVGKKKKKVTQQQVYYRVLRKGEIMSEDTDLKSTSLKHFKDDVEEVAKGDDCGLSLESHNDYEKGDIIECYIKVDQVQSV